MIDQNNLSIAILIEEKIEKKIIYIILYTYLNFSNF